MDEIKMTPYEQMLAVVDYMVSKGDESAAVAEAVINPILMGYPPADDVRLVITHYGSGRIRIESECRRENNHVKITVAREYIHIVIGHMPILLEGDVDEFHQVFEKAMKAMRRKEDMLCQR